MRNRISEYRVMWVLVFFDLPTDTKTDRKHAARFRKDLLEDGFAMFQFSIYMRHCQSLENAEVHMRRVKSFMPPKGSVGMITITDKQFGKMELFHQGKPKDTPSCYIQLELF